MPASKRKLDFRGVKDRSGFRTKHFPEGDYKGKIIDVDDHESDNGEGWVYTIQVKNGKFPYYVMTYDKKQLWKVRNTFIAAGMKVPKKLLAVDPNKVVGKMVGVTLEDDEYEGRLRSKIADLIPLSDLTGVDDDDDEDMDEEVDEEVEEEEVEEEEDDEEEEEVKPKAKKKAKAKKAKPKPVDDEDEEVDDEELEELEVEEL